MSRLLELVQSIAERERAVGRLRSDVQELKTKLAAANADVESAVKHQQQLTEQRAAWQRQKQARLDGLRKEFEGRIAAELAQIRTQLAEEHERDLSIQMETFEARQREAFEQILQREILPKAQELERLKEEIGVQTRQLADRLGELEAGPDATRSLERSTTQALERRREQLEARRAQLASEHAARVAKERAAFMARVREEHAAEQEKRRRAKEAGLRADMAGQLKQAEAEEDRKVDPIDQGLKDAEARHRQLIQQQALLSVRVETTGQMLAASTRELEALNRERQPAVNRLEQELQVRGAGLRPEVLSWLGRLVQRQPPEAATLLKPIQERLQLAAQQAEQQRLARERELALRLARQAQQKMKETQEREEREQRAKSRRAEELLVQADRLASAGRFDEALDYVAEARSLEPAYLSKAGAVREEILTAKVRMMREVQTAELERIFLHAMQLFEQGRDEEAIVLFQQVIETEARMNLALGDAAAER
jgi:hypothetical protein